MARKSERASLRLSDEERERLKRLSGSRTAPGREVERAKMLLRYVISEKVQLWLESLMF